MTNIKYITFFLVLLILNISILNAEESNELIIEDGQNILSGTNFTDTSNVVDALFYNVTPDEIQLMKQKKEEILEAQERKLVDYSGSIKQIVYKGGFAEIVLRLGYVTLISFKDEFGNNLEINTYSIGENNINLQKTATNQLILTPTKKYFSTNMIVMINGYDKPVHIKIKESLTATPDTELNILIPSAYETIPTNKEDSYTTAIQLKRQITMELLKYNEIINAKKINFKAIDLTTNREISSIDLFSKIRFFLVERQNKSFLVAEINNKYSIVGNSYGNFSRYNNSKSIYFLDDNLNILMITNKKNDYSEDINFIEKKGINHYNEFKRIKIILNK